MNFKFECFNIKSYQIYCTIDGVPFKCDNTEKGIIAQLKLNLGKHCLTIKRRTLYDTPLCYLNALNIVFLFYQWNCAFNRDLAFDESHAEIKIQFEIKENVTAAVTFDCKKTYILNSLYYRFSFECLNYHNIKIDKTTKINISKKSINRFKATRILSMLLYSITVSLLFLMDIILYRSNIGISLIGFVINLFLTVHFIYKVINSKSINYICGKNNEKKKKRRNKHI